MNPSHQDNPATPAAGDGRPVVHTLSGSHIAGVATPGRGARQVEMWVGRMDAGASTPPHVHDTEQVVHFTSGRGWVTVEGRDIPFQPGDTVILPAGIVHQLVAETESAYVAAMPAGGTLRLPYGEVIDLPGRR
jgi:quercetin dioxygenase-like cupin family protein